MKNPHSEFIPSPDEFIASVGRPLASRSEERDVGRTFGRVRTPLMLLVAAFALAACSRAEAPQTSSPAVSPPSGPASNSGSRGGASANPSPGTADGAAATLPPSTTATSTPAPAAAVDAKETNPRGNLSKEVEQRAMPQAQQVNNHSSPALDRDTGKP